MAKEGGERGWRKREVSLSFILLISLDGYYTPLRSVSGKI